MQGIIDSAQRNPCCIGPFYRKHPQTYAATFKAMHSLRHEPSFATPFYRGGPLYQQLDSRGLDVSLSLQMQVEAVMRASSFQLP